jgi:Ser/Thr protein kinase RdoA (MazF antagonist)
MAREYIAHFSCFSRSVKSQNSAGKANYRPADASVKRQPMDELAAVLAHYPRDCQPTSVEPLGSAGGMSGAQFWRVTAPRGMFALRRWPTEHPTPDHLQFIHAVLNYATAHGCGVLPLPVTTRTGETFVSYADYLWELAPWMPGAADYENALSVEKLRAAMHTLAHFHTAVADFDCLSAPGSAGGSNAVHRHLARLRDLSPAMIFELKSAIRDTAWPELAPLARQLLEQLPLAVPQAIHQLEPLSNIRLLLQPCIRDIWHDHVLFTGNQVTGVVDFGAVAIDTPATDVARLLGSLAQASAGQGTGSTSATNIWREGLSAYQTVRSLSTEEIQAVHALDASGTILAGCNWIRWIYIDGRQFDDHRQVVERFRRILNRCASIR